MNKNADRSKLSTGTPVKIETLAVESTPAGTSAAEPQIRIDSDVTRRIRQHARAHLKTEVCGVLIGESGEGVIEIRASIEALNAAQGGTHVTFTQDAWEEIYKVKDDLYPDERIVGWYHSHPGFGIFLSEHDLFIQENFFSSPGQVAWVYDPHSDDEGCFGWVAGMVARLTSISTLYQSGDTVEHAFKGNGSDPVQNDDIDADDSTSRSSRPNKTPLWVTASRMALTHAAALLAGFAAAYFFFPRLVALLPDPASNSMLVVDYHALRTFFDGKGPAPKPIDVFNLPASVPSSALPGPQAGPASSAANAGPSSATTPPAEQSGKPQPATARSQK